MELAPLFQHGLDEDVQLVRALVLGPVDPLVVPLTVCKLVRVTSSGRSMVGIVGGDMMGPVLVSTSACRLKHDLLRVKQVSPMPWLVSVFSWVVFLAPPPLWAFLFLPSL